MVVSNRVIPASPNSLGSRLVMGLACGFALLSTAALLVWSWVGFVASGW